MNFDNRQDARDYINSLLVTELQPARKRGYICPLCQNGSGADGDGIVTKDGKHYTCFVCNFSGDYLDFLKKKYNADENAIFEKYNITIGNRKPEYAHNTPQGANLRDFFLQAINALWSNENALNYLYERNLTDETIRRFQIGYVENWISPTAQRNGKTVFPSKRIIIPTSDSSYIARAIDPNNTAPKMKEGKSEIFNTSALYADNLDPVFVVEGEIDAMSVIQCGFDAVGLGSLYNAEKFIDAVRERKPKRPIVISLDNETDEIKQNRIEDITKKITDALSIQGIKNISANTSGIFKDQNEYLQNDATGLTQILEKIARSLHKPHDISDYLNTQFFSEIESYGNQERPKTGFSGIDDNMDDGIDAGLYILGAIPSIGKTTFMWQMANNFAIAGNEVIFFSLEQSKFELASKTIAREIGIKEFKRTGRAYLNSRDIRRGKNADFVRKTAMEYSQKIGNRLSVISGNFSVTVPFIENYVSRYMYLNDVKPIVFIDYLQIIQPEKDKKFFSSKELIEYNLTELKKFQADTDITIFLISALNRENYLLPIDFKSFRETSGIEYTADFVAGLQYAVISDESDDLFTSDSKTAKKRIKLNNEKSKYPRQIEFVCLKNRYGNLFSCGFDYYPNFDYFQDNEAITYRQDAKRIKVSF